MKKQLFAFLFVASLAGCALNAELEKSQTAILHSTAGTSSSMNASSILVDDTANIYEWWCATCGVSQNPTVMGSVNQWNGSINNTIGTTAGNLNIPLAPFSSEDHVFTFDGTNDAVSLSTASRPITGNISIAFNIRKTSKRNAPNPLFDSNTSAPRVKLFLEWKATDSNIAFTYGSTTYDTGVDFPYGSGFKSLVFVFNTTTAEVWVEGSKVYTTSISGTGVNINQTIWLFKHISSPFGSYDVKGVRIYESAIDSAAIVGLGGKFMSGCDLNDRPAALFFGHGQSNDNPNVSYNIPSNYPAYLQKVFATKIWDFSTSLPHYRPLDGTTLYQVSNLKHGPLTSAANDLEIKYPDYDIFIFNYSAGGTSYCKDWAVGTSMRASWMNRALMAKRQLLIECRTIAFQDFFDIIGERDSENSPMPPFDSASQCAYSYKENLTGFVNEAESVLGEFKSIVISKLSVNSAQVWASVTIQQQLDFIAADTVKRKLIPTDDLSFCAGPHYCIPDLCAIGSRFSSIE